MRSKLIHFSDLNSDKICFEKSLMDGETNSENRQKVLKILMNVIENDLTDRQRHCVFEYYFNGKKDENHCKRTWYNSSRCHKTYSNGSGKTL